MLARDLMTTDVVTVGPDTSAAEVAHTLMSHGISAVPVVDRDGSAIGMVSEGDLIGRSDAERDARRDWWLGLLAEGEEPTVESLRSRNLTARTARELMAAPVVTVTETTDSTDIARVLRTYRIKRVPVVRDGKIVGIVSRADLLRAFADAPAAASGAPAPPKREGFLTGVVESIHEHFVQGEPPEPGRAHPDVTATHHPERVSADDFRRIEADHWQARARHQEEEHEQARAQRRQRVAELIEHHVPDEYWRELMHRARAAAEAGEKEFLLFRFPAQLCSDGGRAVNVPDPSWPATLRGEAAEIYLRWEHVLKPQGFHLTARVLDFPGGIPGDIGLFLVWGE